MENKSTQHWITLGICCALAASSVGIQSNSYGVFYTAAANGLGVGQGAYALHTTCSNLCMGLFCPIAFQITKKKGLNISILLGAIVVSLCTAAMGVFTALPLLYAVSILRGMANSFLAIAMVSVVINNWFDQKHGLANGLAMSFSGLSGAIFSPVFSKLIGSIGWQNTYFVMAVCTFVLALPAALFLKFTPEEKHLLPYGATAPKAQPVTQSDTKKHEKLSFSSNDKLCLALLLVFAVSWNMLTGLTQYFVGFASSLEMSAATGAAMVSAAMIGNIVFKLLIGVFSDRIGAVKSTLVFAAINLAALVVLMFANTSTSTVILLGAAFFFGTVYSVGVVGLSLLTRKVFSKERYDVIFPYLNIAIYLGGAVTLTLIGFAFDKTGSYTIAMEVLAAIILLDIVIISLLGRTIAKKEGNRT